ncbi:hypothetical protein ACFYP4_10935 [Streptomyces sp. NPDC005551]
MTTWNTNTWPATLRPLSADHNRAAGPRLPDPPEPRASCRARPACVP